MYYLTPLNAQVGGDSLSANTTTASADRRNVFPNWKLKISTADSRRRNTCEPMVKDKL